MDLDPDVAIFFIDLKEHIKKNIFTSLFGWCFWIRDPGTEIRYPGSVKIRIRDPG
jgi:hypothetical protein